MEEQALIFMGCCLFLPMLIPLFIGSPEPEVIVKHRPVAKIKYIKYPETKFIKPKQKIVKVKAPQEEKVVIKEEVPKISKEDAIECLTSLGLKKAAANKKVNELFQKNKYNSLEEFLMDAYKL